MDTHATTLASAQLAWSEGRYLDAGAAIYEHLSAKERAIWASNLLSFCREHGPSVKPIDELLNLAAQPRRWNQANEAFYQVREITLFAEREPHKLDRRLRSMLYVAENAAKVIYNASGPEEPFDHDAGWWLAPCLQHFLTVVGNSQVTEAGMNAFFEPARSEA
jgi:hypothetical protein